MVPFPSILEPILEEEEEEEKDEEEEVSLKRRNWLARVIEYERR